MYQLRPLILFAFCFPFLLRGQTAHLKKTIMAADRPALQKTAAECLPFEANMQISFNSYDLYDDKKTKGTKPASLENIKELEKQLKGSSADAEVFAAMSDIYQRLHLYEEAEASRQKATYLLDKVIEEHPDSVDAMFLQAGVYMSGGRFTESISMLKRSLAVKPDYSDPNLMIAMMYIFGGKYDSIYPFIKERIDKYPEVHSSYVALSIHYFYSMYKGVSELDRPERILGQSTDSVMEMKLLYDYWQRNPGDFKREYLYRVCYQTTLNAYLIFKGAQRPGFDAKNVVFAINEADKAKVMESEKFFRACLKNKEVPNKYLVNKTLGNIYMVLDNPQKAIPYFKKGIELRPLSKSTTQNNADQEYENLIACYFILKDSAACEKVMLEKIKVNPAIDPNAYDYEHLGDYYLAKKKYANAEKMYQKAIELNFASSKALTGLAYLRWMDGNKKAANDFVNKAYAADKNNWRLYCLSGVMALEDNDAKNAWEFFKIAKRISDDGEWIDKTFIDPYLEIRD